MTVKWRIETSIVDGWISRNDGPYGQTRLYCPHCHKHSGLRGPRPFCPWCGEPVKGPEVKHNRGIFIPEQEEQKV